MMGGRHVDRLWIIAGVALVVVLTFASWQFLITPKYAEADDIHGQTETTRVQLVALQRKLSDLRAQSLQLPTYRAALLKNQQALPSDSGVPEFLRQLQASGDKTSVTVSGITVENPMLAKGTSVYQLPMTLAVQGNPGRLSAFLVQLQNVQPRAVLIDSANLTSQVDSASGISKPGDMQLNLALKAFVAPPAGAGAPTITTD
jgi:Tfp pilus assembly protein PilO